MDNRFAMFKRNSRQSQEPSSQPTPKQTVRGFSSQPRSFGLGSSLAQKKSRSLAVTKKSGCRSCRGAV